MNRLEEKSSWVSILLILGCLVASSKETFAQSAADINKAKQVLSKMGIAIEGLQVGSLSPSASAALIKAPREGRVENPKQALESGINLAGLADPRPTPVEPGTKVYFIIKDQGKIVFYLNEWNMMKNTNNQPTPVHVNPGLLPADIEVNYGSFPTRT